MIKKKQLRHLFYAAFILVFLMACEKNSDLISTEEVDTATVLDADAENIDDHDATADYTWSNSDVITITLKGSTIDVSGTGATVNGSKVTITTAGTYSFTGSLSDGQIIIDTEDETIVRLILGGVDISCSNNAPIYIENAKKAMIVLAENTQNSVSDGSSYSSDEEDANAAIFSKQNLTIYGDGSLNVNGNYNDGITSKDGLIITSGNITVNAVDDGIRGKDYLIIKNANITVNASGDGLKSDNNEDSGTGYITIEDGTLNITAGGDAIQAEQDVTIYSGEINLQSGGGSGAYVSADASAKGIKSGISTLVYGGTITIDAADDAIHTNGNMEIYDGTFYIASGDDGMHSEYDTEFTSGNVYITDSYEGLESALGSITINGGNFDIVASDDGINISAGGSSHGARKSASASSNYALIITAGYINIDCEGDGLDSNDLLDISGGTQLVNSDSKTENSSLDYDGSCVVDGGFLLGVGSSRMSMAPGTSSTQYSFLIDFSSALSAGNIIHIKDSNGSEILTYEPHKTFQSLVFSSSKLSKGSTYQVYIGGTTSVTAKDGLYSSGTYSGGTKYGEFTISNMVTTINM